MTVSGFVDPDNDPSKMWPERPDQDGGTQGPVGPGAVQNGLVNSNDAATEDRRTAGVQAPHGVTVLVGGTPALAQDSISTLFDKLPLMAVLLVAHDHRADVPGVRIDGAADQGGVDERADAGLHDGHPDLDVRRRGHGSGLLNYTPQPLLAPMIGLIIAVIWGLSTDYEVFLVSRMVEARERGMSTAEAIRIGTATTGRLITGAALVLAVVVGAFAFSDLVMMKYLAFGLLIALLLDATVIRMFLVPAVMKLLGDDCWWAPRWMKRVQQKLGLGETELPDERKRPVDPRPDDRRTRRRRRARRTRRTAARSDSPRRSTAPQRPRVELAPRPRAPPAVSRRRPATDAAATSRETPATATHPTTRFAVRPADAARDGGEHAATPRAAPPRPASLRQRGSRPLADAPHRPTASREIESWLGDLRGRPAKAPRRSRRPRRRPEAIHATRACPRRRHRLPPEPATRGHPGQHSPPGGRRRPRSEQLNAEANAQREDDSRKRRRGGGVSAQDLLRREGRL